MPTIVSSDQKIKTYEGILTIPQWTANCELYIDSIEVKDLVGNLNRYSNSRVIIEAWDLNSFKAVASNIDNPGTQFTFTALPNTRYGLFAWYSDNREQNLPIYVKYLEKNIPIENLHDNLNSIQSELDFNESNESIFGSVWGPGSNGLNVEEEGGKNGTTRQGWGWARKIGEKNVAPFSLQSSGPWVNGIYTWVSDPLTGSYKPANGDESYNYLATAGKFSKVLVSPASFSEGENLFSKLPDDIQKISIHVSNTSTNPHEPQDQYAPSLVGLTVNKTSLDVSAADQKVKVQLTINNDDLPTNYWIGVDFNLVGENGYGNGNLISPLDFKLVSGSVANGVYEGTLTIPRYAKNGNYTISSIYINENNQSGSNKSYNRWGDSIPAEFRKTISVTGTQDVTAPVLQSIAVSPTSADTRNGTVSVTANLTITDDLSGLQETQWSRAGALVLRSPSGKEFLWSEFSWADRISGNNTNGTYQIQFELPQYSEEGAWTIDYIELVDKNYNTRFLIPANLTAPQLAASTIQVQGWPRGWETLSSTPQTSNQAKAVITKQSAKFWFPIANIDGNWTWGTGEGGYSFQGDYLEYDWSIEVLRNPKYWLSFTHLKKPNETAQSGNFTEFLAAGQVNVWEDSADGGTIIESASISASRNGTCLLIELTDSAVLSKLQKAMPSYVPFLSFDPSSGSYDNQNVKVEYVKEDVPLSLGNLTHTADGTDKIPSVTSTPGNHTQDVTITYNGTTSPPSEPGTYTVVAYLNEANYKGRQVATMTISKPIQTIAAFSAISDKVFGAAPFVVTAPTSSSSLPVTLSVKSGPATISANNTVTLIGAGTVVLAANQAGNENYSAASEVTTSFSVSKSSQTIAAFGAISEKVFGAGPFAVTVPTSSFSLPVTLSVKSGPASVNGNIVTLTGAGIVVLAANQAGNANYNAAPEVTTSFSVTAPPVPAPPAPAPQAPAASNTGKKPAASKSNSGAAAKKPAASKSNSGAAAKKPAASKSNSGAAAKKPAAKKAKKK